MIIIEFEENIKNNEKILLNYRDINNDNWQYLYIDLETLNLLISYVGIISINRFTNKNITSDNGTLSEDIAINYCGSEIIVSCAPYLSKYSHSKFVLENLIQI
jgi:hypothetical protein